MRADGSSSEQGGASDDESYGLEDATDKALEMEANSHQAFLKTMFRAFRYAVGATREERLLPVQSFFHRWQRLAVNARDARAATTGYQFM